MSYRLFKEVYQDRNDSRRWRLSFEKNRFTLYYWFNDNFEFETFQLIKDNSYVLSHHAVKGLEFLYSQKGEVCDEEFYRSDSKLLIQQRSELNEELLRELRHFENPEFPRLGSVLRQVIQGVPHCYQFDEEEQLELGKYMKGIETLSFSLAQ